MDFQIAEQVGRCIPQPRRYLGRRSGQRCCMAGCATDLSEESAAGVVMEVAPPGTVVDGVGGAGIRINNANLITSLDVPRFVALKCVMSSGVALMRQFAGRPKPPVPSLPSSPGSGRSCVNASLLTPCSTLYASPAKITSDLFCAFQPKRLIVPSLPLWLKVPLVPNAPAFAARVVQQG